MKLYYIILFLTFIISHNSYSSDKRFKVHTLAFYNLENLFDTINDTSKRDEASPIMEMKYNRMVLYEARHTHGATLNRSMFKEYPRLAQVFFM